MLNLKNLAGTLFRGEFYRNPEAVAKELKALEEHPEQFPESEVRSIRKNAEHFIFDLRVYSHNLYSRLFVGVMSDFFGVSGIDGIVVDEEIHFNKIYVKELYRMFNEKPNFVRDFRRTQYSGEITQSGKTIRAKGKYFNEVTDGFWEMYSVGG